MPAQQQAVDVIRNPCFRVANNSQQSWVQSDNHSVGREGGKLLLDNLGRLRQVSRGREKFTYQRQTTDLSKLALLLDSSKVKTTSFFDIFPLRRCGCGLTRTEYFVNQTLTKYSDLTHSAENLSLETVTAHNVGVLAKCRPKNKC